MWRRLLPLLFLVGADQARAEAPALPTLTGVAEVHNLSPAEAARGYPVRFEATVLLNNHVETGGALNEIFVHDGHTGIYTGGRGPASGLQPEDVLELDGRSDVGGFAPYVADPRFNKLATASLPPPRPTTNRRGARRVRGFAVGGDHRGGARRVPGGRPVAF